MSGPTSPNAVGSLGQALTLDRMGAASGGSGGAVRSDATFANLLRDAVEQPLSLQGNVGELASTTRQSRGLMDIAAAPMALETNAAISLREMPAQRMDELRESAKQLVASALLMPVLEQMDASPLRPTKGPFAQTTVERRFGPLLHQHMADRMMKQGSFGLVDAVIKRMAGGNIEVTG